MSKGWVLFVLAFVGCLGVTACGGGGTSDPGDSETNASDGDTEKADGDVDTDKADGDADTGYTPINAGDACTTGQTTCDRSKLYTCVNSIWTLAADCMTTSQTCYANKCVAPAPQGSCDKAGTVCFHQNVFSCSGGSWSLTQNCASSSQDCWQGACIDPETTGYPGCELDETYCVTTATGVEEYLCDKYGDGVRFWNHIGGCSACNGSGACGIDN